MSPDSNSSKSTKRRVNNQRPLIIFVVIILLILLCGAFYFAWNKGEMNEPVSEPVQTVSNSTSNQEPIVHVQHTSIEQESVEPAGQITQPPKPPVEPASTEVIEETESNDSQTQLTETEPEEIIIDTQQTIIEPTTPLSPCEQSALVVRDFFIHLDSQPYIQDFLKGQKSQVYFTDLIQKLVNNPPVVSKETDDLFTILKNTAHFYRILGKSNIHILKAILHNEKKQVENVLSHFYKLSQIQQCSDKQLNLHLPKEALYDYSGFFLNTMGGRLYLFRRASSSRLTVSYYSIMLIELANREGRNSHGIDIRPALELLIPEIENSGKLLLMRDAYLEKLYELEARMN